MKCLLTRCFGLMEMKNFAMQQAMKFILEKMEQTTWKIGGTNILIATATINMGDKFLKGVQCPFYFSSKIAIIYIRAVFSFPELFFILCGAVLFVKTS